MKEWRPNWANKDQYPAKDAESKVWAWEFLRRHTGYHKDRLDLQSCLSDIGFFEASEVLSIKQHSKKTKQQAEKVFLKGLAIIQKVIKKYHVIGYFADYLPDPSLSGEEQLIDFVGTGEPKIFDRLQVWVDDEDVSKSCLRSAHLPQIIELMDREDYEKNEEKELRTKIFQRDLVVSISLDGNLKEQIEIITKVAEAQQKKIKEWGLYSEVRNVTKNYQNYLRALDAYEDGVKVAEIAAVLLPTENDDAPDYPRRKKIRNWIKQATAIRDHDYLKIIKISNR